MTLLNDCKTCAIQSYLRMRFFLHCVKKNEYGDITFTFNSGIFENKCIHVNKNTHTHDKTRILQLNDHERAVLAVDLLKRTYWLAS